MADSEVSSGPEDGVDQTVANVSGTPAVLPPLPGPDGVALPNVESLTVQANQTSTQRNGVAIPGTEFPVELANPNTQQRIPLEVIVSGGTFPNAILGPQTTNRRFEERHYMNTTVNEIHQHYYQDRGSGHEVSSSDPQQPNSPMVQETPELEEGYVRLCDDTVMYVKEPIRVGTNVFKGYQEHISADDQPKRLPVAIKRIVPSNYKHRKEVDHYVTLASHPNVVRIIRSKEYKTPHASVLYIVMELCSPQNLQDYLNESRRNNTPLDFKKTLKFTKQLLKGMKHIHDNGIIHRDVKPENVLLSTDETQLKFTDFGLGKELRQGRTSTMVTSQGQGTVGYRAPETFTTDLVSKSGDIFSLGVTIFGLWSNGNHPYGADILLRDYNIINNTNHDFSGLLITGPLRDDFLDLIRQMLQHNPRHRPTAGDLLKHVFFKNAAREIRASEELSSTSRMTRMGRQERVRQIMASHRETLPKPTVRGAKKMPTTSAFNQEEKVWPNTAFVQEIFPKESESEAVNGRPLRETLPQVEHDAVPATMNEGSPHLQVTEDRLSPTVRGVQEMPTSSALNQEEKVKPDTSFVQEISPKQPESEAVKSRPLHETLPQVEHDAVPATMNEGSPHVQVTEDHLSLTGYDSYDEALEFHSCSDSSSIDQEVTSSLLQVDFHSSECGRNQMDPADAEDTMEVPQDVASKINVTTGSTLSLPSLFENALRIFKGKERHQKSGKQTFFAKGELKFDGYGHFDIKFRLENQPDRDFDDIPRNRLITLFHNEQFQIGDEIKFHIRCECEDTRNFNFPPEPSTFKITNSFLRGGKTITRLLRPNPYPRPDLVIICSVELNGSVITDGGEYRIPWPDLEKNKKKKSSAKQEDVKFVIENAEVQGDFHAGGNNTAVSK